jgi:hypothetical protein
MSLTIDYGNEIIGITSPTTDVNGQVLHDFIEDQMASPEGLLYGDVINPEGKIEDPSNPGVFSQIIIILNSPWQIQFWGGSGYTRIYGAKIVGGLADEPLKATGTAGDITVLESPVDGLTVASGSGLSTEEHDHLLALDTSNLDVFVSSRLASSSYVAPDNQGITDIEAKVDIIDALVDDLIKLTGHKVTKSGDTITIYESNGVDTWRQYDLANGGRIQL